MNTQTYPIADFFPARAMPLNSEGVIGYTIYDRSPDGSNILINGLVATTLVIKTNAAFVASIRASGDPHPIQPPLDSLEGVVVKRLGGNTYKLVQGDREWELQLNPNYDSGIENAVSIRPGDMTDRGFTLFSASKTHKINVVNDVIRDDKVLGYLPASFDDETLAYRDREGRFEIWDKDGLVSWERTESSQITALYAIVLVMLAATAALGLAFQQDLVHLPQIQAWKGTHV